MAKKYFPSKLSEQELYQKVSEMIEYTESMVKNDFKNIKNKYSDYVNQDTDFLKQTIKESKYEYLLNVLNFEDEDIVNFMGYLSLVHSLKGTQSGLELVFKLMSIEAEITNWWEMEPKGDPNTADVEINLNMSKVLNDTVEKLFEFFRQYIYPIISLTITYSAIFESRKLLLGGSTDQTFQTTFDHAFFLRMRFYGVTDISFTGELT